MRGNVNDGEICVDVALLELRLDAFGPVFIDRRSVFIDRDEHALLHDLDTVDGWYAAELAILDKVDAAPGFVCESCTRLRGGCSLAQQPVPPALADVRAFFILLPSAQHVGR